MRYEIYTQTNPWLLESTLAHNSCDYTVSWHANTTTTDAVQIVWAHSNPIENLWQDLNRQGIHGAVTAAAAHARLAHTLQEHSEVLAMYTNPVIMWTTHFANSRHVCESLGLSRDPQLVLPTIKHTITNTLELEPLLRTALADELAAYG